MHAIREAPATGKASRLEAIKAVAAASAGEASGAAPEAAGPPRVVSEFRRADFGLADARRNVWHAFAPEEMLPSDLEGNPQVWISVDSRAQAGDRIEVLHRGTQWWAEALVVSGARGRFRVKVLRTVDIPHDPALSIEDVPSGYRIRESRPDEGAGLFFVSERVEEGGRVLVRMNSGLEHRTWAECLAHLHDHPAVKDRPR